MKPKHQRLIFVAASVISLCIATMFVMQAFRENLIFFYSPSDIVALKAGGNRLVRIGGLVEAGSFVQKTPTSVTFRVTDGKNTLPVSYEGMLPGLFREGQGVVAEGYLREDGTFEAKRVLTKHDEKYMPREVVDALKKSGKWREGNE
jgi:cytochrome c-type biogenesis protein CcmE